MAIATAQDAYDSLAANVKSWQAATDAGFQATQTALGNKANTTDIPDVSGFATKADVQAAQSTTFYAYWDHTNLRWYTVTARDSSGNPTATTIVTSASHPDWSTYIAYVWDAMTAANSTELGDLTWLPPDSDVKVAAAFA